MDLKDLILSTLAEIEKDDDINIKYQQVEQKQPQKVIEEEPVKVKPKIIYKPKLTIQEHLDQKAMEKENSLIHESIDSSLKTIKNPKYSDEEILFLTLLRERVLVLFEGLQSPNNKSIDTKIDLILNFFEYLLALIDKRVEDLSINR
ncbi:MAG: hypothetical protein HXX81_08195 [Campylobacterales bacterium]|nr:hypothetical protein [Campylobacterales bacterium]